MWEFGFQLYDFMPYRMPYDAESIIFYRHSHESLFKG